MNDLEFLRNINNILNYSNHMLSVNDALTILNFAKTLDQPETKSEWTVDQLVTLVRNIPLNDTINEAIHNNRKIAAVKELRNRTGSSLINAKLAIEQFMPAVEYDNNPPF